MDVILDGKPMPSTSSARTVEELLAGAIAARDDRMIVSAHLDGRAIDDEEMATLLARPLNTPGHLELATESIRLLTAGALGQAVEALEETRSRHVPIAEHLAAGRQTEAMTLLAEVLSAWEAADRTLRQAGPLAGLDLSAPTAAGSASNAPAAHIAACRDTLCRIQHGLAARDYVEVADVVEHELPGLTDRWQEMLVGLQQSLLPTG